MNVLSSLLISNGNCYLICLLHAITLISNLYWSYVHNFSKAHHNLFCVLLVKYYSYQQFVLWTDVIDDVCLLWSDPWLKSQEYHTSCLILFVGLPRHLASMNITNGTSTTANQAWTVVPCNVHNPTTVIQCIFLL